jgi:hypothetical protein
MEGSKLDSVWKVSKLVVLCSVPNLVAYGRFQTWWFMKCPSLEAYGRRGENIHLISFSFPYKMISPFPFTIYSKLFALP